MFFTISTEIVGVGMRESNLDLVVWRGTERDVGR
jgi:hypothetical protein